MGPGNRVLWESLTVLSQIREVQFLEKINFLLFLGHKNEFSINLRGPKKVFLDSYTLFCLWKLDFWGVILLILLQLDNDFAAFWKKLAKTIHEIKKC